MVDIVEKLSIKSQQTMKKVFNFIHIFFLLSLFSKCIVHDKEKDCLPNWSKK